MKWLSTDSKIVFFLKYVIFQICHHNHSLEEANEYEYLKNILFQYMMGKEPVTKFLCERNTGNYFNSSKKHSEIFIPEQNKMSKQS